MTPDEAIEAARAAVESELDEIVEALAALAARAKAARGHARELTSMKERGEALETKIRTTLEDVRRKDTEATRPPEAAEGEFVDEDHLKRVKEARNGSGK